MRQHDDFEVSGQGDELLERAVDELRRPLRVNADLFDARVMDEVLRAPTGLGERLASFARPRTFRISPLVALAAGLLFAVSMAGSVSTFFPRRSSYRSARARVRHLARRSSSSDLPPRTPRASRSWVISTTGIRRRHRCAPRPRAECGRGSADTTRPSPVCVRCRWQGVAARSRRAESNRRRFRRAELRPHRRRARSAMNHCSLALFAVAALSIAPAALLAQDARLDARLDPRTRDAVVTVVDSARAEGIPSEPLVQKALEGRASMRTDLAFSLPYASLPASSGMRTPRSVRRRRKPR
jgi:hypothetical protein